MAPRERRKWIVEYITVHEPHGVDVLNSDFVDAYTAATGAKFRVMMWGANRCAQLGNDLLTMTRLGVLKRCRIGLAGNWQPGFPKWVWSYSLRVYS